MPTGRAFVVEECEERSKKKPSTYFSIEGLLFVILVYKIELQILTAVMEIRTTNP